MVSGQISDMQRNLRENLDNFAISIVPADGPAQQDAMTFDFKKKKNVLMCTIIPDKIETTSWWRQFWW